MKYLVVGLGNPEERFDNTRHNIGFKSVDALAKTYSASWKLEKHGWITKFRIKNAELVLLKPNTYMNSSGIAIRYWMQEEKIDSTRLLVVVDDLSLPFGVIRLRGKGSDAGHNGLKNIESCLGSNKYPRLKFGIGNNFEKGQQINYVLGTWTKEESSVLPGIIEKVGNAISTFCLQGLDNAMTIFNKVTE